MTTRTVKVLGWGNGGKSSATITAILDGETVFSGAVDLAEMTQDNESEQTAPTLFTFEVPMDFTGTKHMVISVKDAPVRFGQIVANYTEVEMGAVTYSTGADIYSDVATRDGAGVADPRGDSVIIDGQTHEANRLIGKGTWHWPVNPGSTFEHDITIDKAGLEE
jgi:hypothetical protein